MQRFLILYLISFFILIHCENAHEPNDQTQNNSNIIKQDDRSDIFAAAKMDNPLETKGVVIGVLNRERTKTSCLVLFDNGIKAETFRFKNTNGYWSIGERVEHKYTPTGLGKVTTSTNLAWVKDQSSVTIETLTFNEDWSNGDYVYSFFSPQSRYIKSGQAWGTTQATEFGDWEIVLSQPAWKIWDNDGYSTPTNNSYFNINYNSDYVEVYFDVSFTSLVTTGKSWDLDFYDNQKGSNGPDSYFSSPYTPDEVVGIAMNSNSETIVWYSDGKRSKGRSYDFDYHTSASSYSMPSGYTPSDIVAIAIANNNRVYAFYDNGKVSTGTSTDLDYYKSPYNYSLPSGYSVSDIVGMGITSGNVTIAWYDDGKKSKGKTSDLDYHEAPTTYTEAPETANLNNVGMAVHKSDNHIFAWYYE